MRIAVLLIYSVSKIKFKNSATRTAKFARINNIDN